MKLVAKFLSCEDGVTAVEYAVMLAAIVAVLIASIISVGQFNSQAYDNAATSINSVLTP